LDIVLKLYSTTTNWGDTLDHIIYGDILDYEIVDNSNYLIDTAWFKINNTNNKWSDQIDVDVWDGSETTQVWRAFTRADQLINSGVVTRVSKESGHTIIEGEGMTSLLKRYVIEDKRFHINDNSSDAISGTYMLTSTENDGDGNDMGLIPRYLSTTYGAIGVSTYVGATNTDEPRDWKFYGEYLYDACVDIAKASYGINNKSFDVYLFETYSAPSTFTRELYFQEFESTAKAKTIVQSDVYIPNFFLSPHCRENYNKVYVQGEMNPNYIKPDNDQYCEGTESWSSDVETGGTATIDVVGNNQQIVGTTAIKLYRGDAAHRVAYIRDISASPIESYFHSIQFSALAQSVDDTDERLKFYLGLGVEDVYGNQALADNEFFAMEYECWILANKSSGAYGFQWDFTSYNPIPLPKPTGGHDWNFDQNQFSNSNINYRDWHKIVEVGFRLDDDATEEIQYLVIDNLRFIGNYPYNSTWTNGAPTYTREYRYTDDGLKSDTTCQNMAKQIGTGLNVKQYSGNITLKGIKRDFTLKSGNTIEIIIPSKNINISSGQTPAKIGVQKIVYKPNTQTLTVGRVYSTSEIVNNIARSVRRSKKIF